MLSSFRTFFVSTVATLLALVLLGPWLLYEIGLRNISGHPSVPAVRQVGSRDAHLVWEELKESGPIRVQPLTPYSYIKSLMAGELSSPGARTAWYVARDYNADNLHNKEMISWHVSGAALTIWLTCHWNADELLAKAGEIRRAKALAFDSTLDTDGFVAGQLNP